jgi:hypothetical protein
MPSSKTPKRGRPSLPPEEVRSEVIRMRATKVEKASYEERGGEEWLRRELANKPRFIGERRTRWPQKEGESD